MVTRAAIDRLGARIEALAAVIDPGAGTIAVAVFAGETPEFALQRHCELRPEHAGRRARFDRRARERDEMHELCATWAGATEADFQDFRRLVAEISTSDGGRQFVEEFAGKPHDNGNNSLW